MTPRTGDDPLVTESFKYTVDSEDPSKVRAEAVDNNAAIMITGVASTQRKIADNQNMLVDTNTFMATGVTITVTATDQGGLPHSRTFNVIVNGQPAPHSTHKLNNMTIDEDDEPLEINVSLFFSDPDSPILGYMVPGADTSAPDGSSPYVGVLFDDNTNVMTLTPLSLSGSREVKVRATESAGTLATDEGSSVGQWRELSFTVSR